MTMEARMAVPKDSILKPSIKLEAIDKRMALMTNKNKPRVRMVTGKVRRISSGFTRRLRSAKTRATMTAVV